MNLISKHKPLFKNRISTCNVRGSTMMRRIGIYRMESEGRVEMEIDIGDCT